MLEKRRFRRIAYKEPVQFRVPGQAEPEGCLACDLSEVGIRLNSHKFIPLQERMAITLPVNDEDAIDIQGQVVWVQRVPHSEYYQVGLAFDPDTDDQSLKELQEYIQSH